MSEQLSNLSTREAIQSYLLDLSKEVGVSLDDVRLAAELDKRDKLAGFRSKFHIPTIGDICEEEGKRGKDADPTQDCIYVCGNSCGLEPKGAMDLIRGEMDKWSKKGVHGHMAGQFPWYTIEDVLVAQSVKLVGAKPIEVAIMNTLTVNCHLGMVSFYQPTKDRYKVLVEASCFPSDRFVVQSQLHWHGYDPNTSIIEVSPRENESVWRTEDIVKVIEEQGDSIALVYLSGVHYATGHLFDMKTITEAAHKKGCYAMFDLAHAAGNVELHLHDWGVDCAMWCTYKYINAGPGAIAGFFVHERHAHNSELPRLLGWWSHNRATRLKMPNKLELQPGAAGFQLSNPPVLQCMLLKASLDVFEETSMTDLCAKSRILTGYLELLIEQNLTKDRVGGSDKYVEVLTSPDPRKRGCQLSVCFSWSLEEVDKYLGSMGAVYDLRQPNIMRLAPAPLYNSFNDVLRLYQLLKQAATGTN